MALFAATLVEQAGINKAAHGRFTLRLQQLDGRQRAVGDLGYRYGFRILAGAATAVLAVRPTGMNEHRTARRFGIRPA